MVNNKHVIVGVHVTNRMKNAKEVQGLLSEYGCSIKTRLGLHDVDENHCATNGILILELTGDETESNKLISKLQAVTGVELQKMEFGHN